MINSILLFGLPGGSEWIIIILIVLLLFGGRKIPELMKGLGKGIREFNDAKDRVKSDLEEEINKKPTPPTERNSTLSDNKEV